MSDLNTRQTHPLIPREQNYVLDRKLVSFHSYDRDYKKWPYANHFEVQLPENLRNVQSIRLDTITLPNNQMVFSHEYQNTKLSFSLDPYGKDQLILDITISTGSYTAQQLVTEIQNKMNSEVVKNIVAYAAGYEGFVCQYNEIDNTFWFGNELQYFSLIFDKKHDYGALCPGQEIMFNHYTKWGLPSYLGYKKKIYSSTPTPENYSPSDGVIDEGGEFWFDYDLTPWLLPIGGDTNWIVDVNDPQPLPHILDEIIAKNSTIHNKSSALIFWQKSAKICNINILGDDVIYMELDRYNSIDEIAPYSENTSGLFNNDYHGKVNSAFAKIPVLSKAFQQVSDTRNTSLMNVSQYEPPIEKITKLKFKFRYHDGRLVDFNCIPFSFTIEFNMLHDQQLRMRNVRVPNLYRL